MHYSGYQIESMLKQFRRIRGLWRQLGIWPHPRGDPLEMSEEALTLGRAAQGTRAPAWRPPGNPAWKELAVDRTRRDVVIERELERRAASFMPEDGEGEADPVARE